MAKREHDILQRIRARAGTQPQDAPERARHPLVDRVSTREPSILERGEVAVGRMGSAIARTFSTPKERPVGNVVDAGMGGARGAESQELPFLGGPEGISRVVDLGQSMRRPETARESIEIDDLLPRPARPTSPSYTGPQHGFRGVQEEFTPPDDLEDAIQAWMAGEDYERPEPIRGRVVPAARELKTGAERRRENQDLIAKTRGFFHDEADRLGLAAEAARGVARVPGQMLEGVGGMVQAGAVRDREALEDETERRGDSVLFERTRRFREDDLAMRGRIGRAISDTGRVSHEFFPRSLAPDPLDLLDPNSFVAGATDAIGQVGVQLLLAAATRGSSIGQFLMFAGPTAALEGGQSFIDTKAELVQRGMDEKQAEELAAGVAFTTGAGAVALERIPAARFVFRRIPGSEKLFGAKLAEALAGRGNLAVRLASGFGAEATEEVLQEVWSSFIQDIQARNPDAWVDIDRRLVASGVFGGIGGVGGAAMQAAMELGGQDFPPTAQGPEGATPTPPAPRDRPASASIFGDEKIRVPPSESQPAPATPAQGMLERVRQRAQAQAPQATPASGQGTGTPTETEAPEVTTGTEVAADTEAGGNDVPIAPTPRPDDETVLANKRRIYEASLDFAREHNKRGKQLPMTEEVLQEEASDAVFRKQREANDSGQPINLWRDRNGATMWAVQGGEADRVASQGQHELVGTVWPETEPTPQERAAEEQEKDQAAGRRAQARANERVGDLRRTEGREAFERGEVREPPRGLTLAERQAWEGGWDEAEAQGPPTTSAVEVGGPGTEAAPPSIGATPFVAKAVRGIWPEATDEQTAAVEEAMRNIAPGNELNLGSLTEEQFGSLLQGAVENVRGPAEPSQRKPRTPQLTPASEGPPREIDAEGRPVEGSPLQRRLRELADEYARNYEGAEHSAFTPALEELSAGMSERAVFDRYLKPYAKDLPAPADAAPEDAADAAPPAEEDSGRPDKAFVIPTRGADGGVEYAIEPQGKKKGRPEDPAPIPGHGRRWGLSFSEKDRTWYEEYEDGALITRSEGGDIVQERQGPPMPTAPWSKDRPKPKMSAEEKREAVDARAARAIPFDEHKTTLPKAWAGRRSREGANLVTDGYVLLRADRAIPTKGWATIAKLDARASRSKSTDVAERIVQKEYDRRVAEGTVPATIAGVIPADDTDPFFTDTAKKPVPVVVLDRGEGKLDGVVNADKLALVKKLTDFDELRMDNGLRPKTTVAYRDGEPVAVVMAITDEDGSAPSAASVLRRLGRSESIAPPTAETEEALWKKKYPVRGSRPVRGVTGTARADGWQAAEEGKPRTPPDDIKGLGDTTVFEWFDGYDSFGLQAENETVATPEAEPDTEGATTAPEETPDGDDTPALEDDGGGDLEGEGPGALPGVQQEGAAGSPGPEGGNRQGDVREPGEEPRGGEPGPGELGDAGRTGDGGEGRPGPDDVEAAGPPTPAREPQKIRGEDFRLTPEHLEDLGGPKTKARANLEAIRIAKQLEEERRPATREEQEKLARYVGWGGIPNMFPVKEPVNGTWGRLVEKFKPEWKELGTELQGLLTGEAYETAKRSTQYAHYTSPEVIGAVYGALQHMGVSGRVRALEPGAGVGNFIGLSPLDGTWTAVEMDHITTSILRGLYPSANVHEAQYENVTLRDNYYDIVVGNPPFGDIPIRDRRYGRASMQIHDFFFVKSLDKLRPGGILAFVTSTGTMDKAGRSARQKMADRADFLGAVRLPGTAFQKNAGTEVTTDILFFQKREQGAAENHAGDWMALAEVKDGENEWKINEYFVRNPTQMLGDLVPDKLHPSRAGLQARPGDLQEQLTRALQALPKGVYRRATQQQAEEQSIPGAPEGAKEGQYVVKGGKVRQVKNGQLVDLGIDATKGAGQRVAELVGLGEAARAVLDANREGLGDADLKKLQADLQKKYKAFVKAHGPINTKKVTVNKNGTEVVRRPNLNGYNDPVNGPLVQALENYDEDTGKATPTAIQSQRMIGRPPEIENIDTAWKGVTASLTQFGRVDMPFITEQYGKTESEVVAELGDRIFLDPHSGAYEIPETYLSGNVREKLAVAREAAEKNPRFQANVAALEKALPPDVTLSQMKRQGATSIGVTWIAPATYQQFIDDVMGMESTRLDYREIDGKWSLNKGRVWKKAAYDEWGTTKVDAITLFRDLLNGHQTKVLEEIEVDGSRKKVEDTEATQAAEQKKKAIQRRFNTWVFEENDARALALQQRYNELMNHTVLAEWDGEHLRGKMPGIAQTFRGRPLELAKHQLAAVWRILASGNTLLAHEVGAGKTMTMVVAGQEAKRMGIAKKPMYVVPNSMLGQFSRELLEIYPGAKILVADDYQFHTDRRREFLGRIAADDWDAVILTHSSLKLIPTTPELTKNVVARMLAEYEEAYIAARETDADRFTVKGIERAIEKYEKKLETLVDVGRRDNTVYWEDLGIDMLFLDEAHDFKNLSLPTSGSIPLTDAEKTTDLYIKTRHLEVVNPGRGLVFATATPISNSIAEMYVMQRYLDEANLKKLGYGAFDAWAADFVSSWAEPEYTAIGTLEEKHRPRAYRNTFAMAQLFRSVADVKMAKDLNLKTPPIIGGAPELVVVPGSPRLKAFMKALQKRWDGRPKKPEKGDDGVFPVINDGRFGSVDARLVTSPHAAKYGHDASATWENSKAEYAAERVFSIWEETKAVRGTQMIFSDLGVPKEFRGKEEEAEIAALKAENPDATEDELRAMVEEAMGGDGYDLYNDIKARLVAKGVPAAEIAFIQQASNRKKKQALIDRVKSGEVRVLIGSTAMMGQGVNAQDRMVALHHIDVPFKPAHLHQRDGRIVRQGNILYQNGDIEGVRIFRYALEGSYDPKGWQILENKVGFIEQGMTARADTGMVEEVGGSTLSTKDVYAIIKAEASDNPYAMDHAMAQARLKALQNDEQEFRDKQFRYKGRIRQYRDTADMLGTRAMKAKRDAERIPDLSGDKFRVKLGDRTYSDRAEAGEAILKAFDEIQFDQNGREVGGLKTERIGQFAGLDLSIQWIAWNAKRHRFILNGAGEYEAHPNVDGGNALGVVATLENMLDRIREAPELLQAQAEQAQRDMEDTKRLSEQEWDRRDELIQAAKDFRELDQKMKEYGDPPKGDDGDSPDMDEIMSPMARTGEGTVGAGLDPSLFKKLGANMYRENLGKVVTKEAIQNAVDSIRGRDDGKIRVKVKRESDGSRDGGAMEIEISDNGHGMVPDVAANEFMDVGGSAKNEGASGGYGLAKVGILTHAERFSMSTVADTPDGRVRTTIEGSPDEWVSGRLPIRTEAAPESETGTTLHVRFPKDSPADARDAANYLGELMRYDRTGMDLEIETEGIYRPSLQRLDLKPDPTMVRDLPGAKVTIYETEDRSPWGSTSIGYLNNGLYQFSKYGQTEKGAGPSAIVVDIKATVDTGHADYPFTTSREDPKEGVSKFVEQYLKEYRAMAARARYDNIVDALTNPTEIPGAAGTAVYDTTGGRRRDLMDRLSRRKYVGGMVMAMQHAYDVIFSEIAQHVSVDPADFGGIGLDSYLGVNIQRSSIKELRADLQNQGLNPRDANVSDQNLILINPFAIWKESQGRVTPGDNRALAMWLAKQTVGTIIHEIAHQDARGHNERFAGVQTRWTGHALMAIPDAVNVLYEQWHETIRNHQEEFTADEKEANDSPEDRIIAGISDDLASSRRPGGDAGGRDDSSSRAGGGRGGQVGGSPGGPGSDRGGRGGSGGGDGAGVSSGGGEGRRRRSGVGGTEYGDITKPGESRRAQEQRLEKRARRLGAYIERIAEAEELDPKLRGRVRGMIERSLIPNQADAVLQDLAEATDAAGARRALKRARRIITRELHRRALRELQAVLRKANKSKMRPEFLAAIEAATEDIDLKAMSPKTRRMLRATAKYLEQNPDAPVPDSVKKQLARLDQRSVRKLSVEELRAITDAVKMAIHLNRTKNQLIGKRKRQERAAFAARAIGEMKKRVKSLQRTQRLANGLEGMPKRSLLGLFFKEAGTRPEVLLEHLSPALQELVYEDIVVQAHSEEQRLVWRFRDALARAVEDTGHKMGTREFEKWRTTPLELETPDGPVQVSRDEAIWLLTTMKDPSNRSYMYRNGVTLDRSDKHFSFDDETLDHLKEITGPEEEAIARAMFQQFNQGMKRSLNKAWVDVYGYEIARVPEYVPRSIDMDRADTGKDPLEQMAADRDAALTTWGHLRERTGTRAPLRIGSALDTYLNHSEHVARLSAYLAPASNAHTIMGRQDVKQAMIQRVGKRGYDRIMNAIVMQTVRQADKTDFERWVRLRLRMAGGSILAFRLSTLMLNPSGLAISAAYQENGFKHLATALKSGVSPKEWKRVVGLAKKHSPYWRTRYESFVHQSTSGMANDRARKYGRPDVAEIGLRPLEKSDQFGSVIRWKMAEAYIRESQPHLREGSNDFNEAVAREWERLVFRGENSAHGGDMTGAIALGRRNVFFSTLVMFMSSVSKIYSLAVRATFQAQRGERRAAARSIAGVAGSLAWAALVREVLVAMRGGDDDDDELMERAALRLATEAATTIPVFGNVLVAPAIRQMAGKPAPIYSASITDDVLADMGNTVLQTIQAVETGVTGELNAAGEEVWPVHMQRAARGSLDLMAMWFGAPMGGPRDLWRMFANAADLNPEVRSQLRELEGDEDLTQERRQLFQAIRLNDPSRFRAAVDAIGQRGESVTPSDVLAAVNRRYGFLTKYEPGKPERATLPAPTLELVDQHLAERDALRQNAAILARENADLLRGRPVRPSRSSRPSRPSRPRRGS